MLSEPERAILGLKDEGCLNFLGNSEINILFTQKDFFKIALDHLCCVKNINRHRLESSLNPSPFLKKADNGISGSEFYSEFQTALCRIE